jgi:hypothetical protein
MLGSCVHTVSEDRTAMPSLQQLFDEMHVVGYKFDMRSDTDLEVDESFVFGDLTLRVTSKRPDEPHFSRYWPWRFMYGFEVIAAEETQGLERKSL